MPWRRRSSSNSGVSGASGVGDGSNESHERDIKERIPPDKLVRVTFLPEGRTVEFEFGAMPYDHHGKPMSFLDVAENFGIFLDHACGGSCACTTCHLWIKEGAAGISEAEDDELDRLDMAADQQLNSRLGCQAVITRPGELHRRDSELEPQLRLRGQARWRSPSRVK